MRWHVAFTNENSDLEHIVSGKALAAVIEAHGLKPVNGQIKITPELVAEAEALDAAAGYKGLPT